MELTRARRISPGPLRKIRLAAAVALMAGTASAGIALTAPAGQAAVAAVTKPLPAALSGYRLVKTFTASDLAGPAWNDPANEPGGCPPEPASISLTSQGAMMSTTGKAGDCVQAQSPHTYPTAPGYAYEAEMYVSSFRDWADWWMYGDNWPVGGELDIVESTQDQSYVSYHWGAANSTVSTNPWQKGLKALSNNITTGWHVVDVAFGNHQISVYYDGHLYTVIKGSNVTEAPAWIVFGDGSCQSPIYSVCGSSTDIGVAGNVKVKGLRAFLS
jgi:hypothetical protein